MLYRKHSPVLKRLIPDFSGLLRLLSLGGLLLLLTTHVNLFAQQNPALVQGLDSVRKILNSDIPDTTRVRALSAMFGLTYKVNIDTAGVYVKRAVELAEKTKDVPSLARAYHSYGLYYYMKSDYGKALDYNLKTLKYRKQLNDEKGAASILNNIGILYNNQGEFEQAIEAYKESIEINARIGDKKGQAGTVSNLGIIYLSQRKYDDALAAFEQSIALKKEIGATGLDLAYTYEEIGNVYMERGKFQDALEKYELSLSLIANFSDPRAEANILKNQGKTYLAMGRLEDAEGSLSHALDLSIQYEDLRLQQEIYDALASLYKQKGDIHKAWEAHMKSDGIREKIMSDERSKSMVEMRERFDSEKKEEDLKVRSLELEQETLRRNVAIVVLGMVAVSLIIVFILLRQKQKTNRLLHEQKNKIEKQNVELANQKEEMQALADALQSAFDEIHSQKKLMEEQTKQITDSIRYAKDIQVAILPAQSRMRQSFPELFVFNKPRDIVSGDFYWYTQYEEKAFMAVVDCTGHGVPGALMSMVGNDFIDYLINEKEILEVDQVLNQLHKAVRQALKQEERLNADGMEVALCMFDRKRNVLEFAGAKCPIYYVQNGVMHEIRGDKKPIGGQQKEVERIFTKHTIDLSIAPTTFYIFSDGFQDQFGGFDGKKYMSHNFKNFLASIHNEPMPKQLELMDKELSGWMNFNGNSYRQTDDITVVGARLS